MIDHKRTSQEPLKKSPFGKVWLSHWSATSFSTARIYRKANFILHFPTTAYVFSLPLTVCALGYNDFNNLDMQTLWWLLNKILRHIYKKTISVFLSRFLRICYQSLQKVLIRAKKFFIKKFNMGIKKRRISRWFRIRSKSC